MEYMRFVNAYEELSSNAKRLDKTAILASFLKDFDEGEYRFYNPEGLSMRS